MVALFRSCDSRLRIAPDPVRLFQIRGREAGGPALHDHHSFNVHGNCFQGDSTEFLHEGSLAIASISRRMSCWKGVHEW